MVIFLVNGFMVSFIVQQGLSINMDYFTDEPKIEEIGDVKDKRSFIKGGK